MRAILGVVLAGALSLGGAHAAERADNPPMQLPLDGETTNPSWRTAPSADDLAREYPPLAQLMQTKGAATIKCQVEIDGRLDDCHVVSEFPAGLGFGAAAVRSTAYFNIKPATLDGKPVVGSITIPLRFDLGYPPPQAPPPISSPTSPGALVLARQVVGLEGDLTKLRLRWRPTIDQMNARVVLDNQAQSSLAALDAFRQGLEDTLAEELDLRARWLASRMNEADLRATKAFLETAAGKAWAAASNQPEDNTAEADFRNRLAKAARAHLCAQTSCESPGARPATGDAH